MAETTTKLPVESDTRGASHSLSLRWPMKSLQRGIDRLFDDFGRGFWQASFRNSLFDYLPFGRVQSSLSVPAVDIAEKDNEFEITAEIPGMSEKDIEVKLQNNGLLIRGEKKSEKEEKKKDYVLSERHYGTFERYFGLPEGIDRDKIAASFKNGILTITLPKTAEAMKQERNIEVKAA